MDCLLKTEVVDYHHGIYTLYDRGSRTRPVGPPAAARSRLLGEPSAADTHRGAVVDLSIFLTVDSSEPNETASSGNNISRE